jgi:preprotein translocase subunit SecG
MSLFVAVAWQDYMFAIPLSLLSVFLILVILVQRGRGGGLTGALGGMGGQSAFGTKAGDLFTRITIIVATIWILLSMLAIKVLNQQSKTGGLAAGQRGQSRAPLVPGGKAPATSPAPAGAEQGAAAPVPGGSPPAAAPADAAPAGEAGAKSTEDSTK